MGNGLSISGKHTVEAEEFQDFDTGSWIFAQLSLKPKPYKP